MLHCGLVQQQPAETLPIAFDAYITPEYDSRRGLGRYYFTDGVDEMVVVAAAGDVEDGMGWMCFAEFLEAGCGFGLSRSRCQSGMEEAVAVWEEREVYLYGDDGVPILVEYLPSPV